MRRMFNVLNPFSEKSAMRALDKGIFLAALTRVRPGLAELRPQRSRSSNIFKSIRANERMTLRLSRRALS
jgi:hypothetical protein